MIESALSVGERRKRKSSTEYSVHTYQMIQCEAEEGQQVLPVCGEPGILRHVNTRSGRRHYCTGLGGLHLLFSTYTHTERERERDGFMNEQLQLTLLVQTPVPD
jgi:hypothetical protein